VIALVQASGIASIVLYATGADDYYTTGDVSRWDHATNGGSAPIVVAAAVIASAIAFAFLIQGLFPRRIALGPLVIPMVAIYCVSVAVAWFFLTVGH